MKVCKFARIKDEEEIKKIIGSIQKECPYVVAVPAFAPLQEWTQEISVSWFRGKEIPSSTINAIADYCNSLADCFVPQSHLNDEIKSLVCNCRTRLLRMVENTADLLTDKIIKAEIMRLSAEIFAYFLCQQGIVAKLLDTSRFMQLNLKRTADIPYIQTHIQTYMKENKETEVFVAPLSLCKNIYEEVDFLSEKQTDYYATALGSIFGADEVFLSTEIANVHASTHYIRSQPTLTYEEARNLANSGLSLLDAECISLASRTRLNIRIVDMDNLSTEHFHISGKDTEKNVKALLVQEQVTFVRFLSLHVLPNYLFMAKLLEVVNKYKVKVVSMASSNVSVSTILIAGNDTLRLIQKELHRYMEVVVDSDVSVVHIIGSMQWKKMPGESEIIQAIRDIPVLFLSYGGSDHCFTLSVHNQDKERLIDSLSQHFL